MRLVRHILAFMLVAGFVAQPAEAKKLRLKLATLAPDGSTWHEMLKDLKADWKRVSDGQVDLRIYAGGVAGDEPVVMKKMGIDNYHAALISSHGLGTISRSTRVFTIPRLLKNDDELDRAMAIMTPELEAKLDEKGYLVLAWVDAGWVNFFVPNAESSVNSVRNLKLFTWAGDAETTELWQMAGFQVVPLPATELITALKTNLINAFDTMPAYALSSQAFRYVNYMIDMSWGPLPGALVVRKSSWEKIPAELRPALLAEAEKFERNFRVANRQMHKDAVAAMMERGLKVLTPTREELAEWDAVAREAYPEVRGSYVPAEDFDRLMTVVKTLREESR